MRYLRLWSGAVVLGLCALSRAGEAPAAATQLKMSPAALDMGEVQVGDSRTQQVALENPTDKPINVTNVHGSCGCLSPKMPVTLITPGKAENVDVTYTGLFGRKSDTVSVTLTTDEPGAPEIRIPVSAKVRQCFTVTPEVLQFGKLEKGASKTLEAVIRSIDGQAFNVQNVSVFSQEFSAKWDPVEGSGGAAAKVTVSVTGKRGGPLAESIRITTDRGPSGLVLVYVNAAVAADAVCAPVTVTSSPAADGTLAPFVTKVSRLTPGKLEIRDVTETRRLALEWTEKRVDDSNIELTINLKAPSDKRRPIGQFLILTNAEEMPLHLVYQIRAPTAPPKR